MESRKTEAVTVRADTDMLSTSKIDRKVSVYIALRFILIIRIFLSIPGGMRTLFDKHEPAGNFIFIKF